MTYTIRVRSSFAAAHYVTTPGHEPCSSRNHGHFYHVEVALRTRHDAKQGAAYESADLHQHLRELVEEINGRDLQEMLPASLPTHDGLATWFMERLSGKWQRLVAVTIDDVWLERSTTIERELRGRDAL